MDADKVIGQILDQVSSTWDKSNTFNKELKPIKKLMNRTALIQRLSNKQC